MITTVMHYSMVGRTQEAMRELEQVKDKPTVAICSSMALICAHKRSDMIGEWVDRPRFNGLFQ